jgi:hypothetical protein
MAASGAGHLLESSVGLPKALSLMSSIMKVSFTGSPLSQPGDWRDWEQQADRPFRPPTRASLLTMQEEPTMPSGDSNAVESIVRRLSPEVQSIRRRLDVLK